MLSTVLTCISVWKAVPQKDLNSFPTQCIVTRLSITDEKRREGSEAV